MKVVEIPIDAIVIFSGKGHPVPYKFRYKDTQGDNRVVYVSRVIGVGERRLGNVDMLIYECQSIIDEAEIRYQLKYFIPSCRWELYKI